MFFALIGNLYNRTKSIPISWLEKFAKTNQQTKFYADNDVYEAVSILGNACETVLANWYGQKKVRYLWRQMFNKRVKL